MFIKEKMEKRRKIAIELRRRNQEDMERNKEEERRKMEEKMEMRKKWRRDYTRRKEQVNKSPSFHAM